MYYIMSEVNYNNSTWILILNENNELLLLKKIKNWLWTCPWGKFEKWEDAKLCAIRELEEETWINNINLEFFTYSTCINNWQKWFETMFIWYLNENSKINISEHHNFSEYRFFDLNNIPNYEIIENYSCNLIKILKWEKEKILDKNLILNL